MFAWLEICILQLRHRTVQHRLQRHMFVLVTLILSLAVPCAVAQTAISPSWDTRPSNQTQKLGLNVSLDCKVYNLGGRKMTWMKVQGADSSVLFINNESFQALPRHSVTFGVQNVTTFLTLHLTSVQKDDDALYQCSIQGVQPSAVASVTVLVSPGIPSISLDTAEEDLKEDTVVRLSCSSTGGNPPPTMAWYRNGERLPNTSLVMPTTKFGTTLSILVWRLTRADFRANFSCTAKNEDMQGSLVENSTSLLVKYAPVISLGSYNPVIVVENSVLRLNCNISAYPEVDPTAVHWYRNGSSLIGNGTSFTLASVMVGDAGIYVCSAKNFEVRNANVTVDVQYPPRAEPGFREVTVKEGSSVNQTVAFSASPTVNVSMLKWFNGNNFVQSGSFLVIPSVRRSDAGNYTWEATNMLTPSQGTKSQGTGRATIRLRVLYKPGQAVVQVPGIVVLGQNANLTCTVDDQGDPAADLLWSRVGRNDTYPNGTVLQILGARLSHIGNYSCVPKNEAGSGGADVKLLDVTEPASWIQQILPNGINISINGTIDGVICQARGRPAPAVSWYAGGQLIDSTSMWYSINQELNVLEEYSWNVTSTLKWIGAMRRPNSNSLRTEDAGSYTCQAYVPSVGTPVNQTMNVNILYSPRMDSSAVTVGVDVGTSPDIACQSQAFPPPTLIWRRGTSQLENDEKYLIRIVFTKGVFPYRTELHINGFKIQDTGNYTCQATNEFGSSVTFFNLTLNTKPFAPMQLKLISWTWESIELEWKEGYDGGCPQQFLIETQQTSPVSAGNMTRYNLTGLYPNTTYIISVRAENRIGRGNSSNSVTQATNAFILEMPFDVQYHTQSRTLTSRFSKAYDICLKLQVLKTSSNLWYNFSKCDLPSDGKAEIKLDDFVMQDGDTQTVMVSVCLEKRMDICSGAQSAGFVNDLPVRTIVIVCCVCGGFIIILLIVLIVCCCKKRRKLYSDEQHAISAYETPSSPTQNGTKKNGNPAPYTNGIDNPALHQTEYPAVVYGKNGAFLNLDHLYPLDRSDSHGSYGSDSGVSVSEVPKPKRIIHEVIV